MPPIGAILISRNNIESLNDSPGYWNHVAIYVGNDRLVESQRGRGVISTPMSEWNQRDITWGVLTPRDGEVGRRAAEIAKGLVGRPFGIASSVRRHPGRRLNCVSAGFKIPYGKAMGRRFEDVKYPDHVIETGLFSS
jgi:uncharacterized protein YycO